MSAKAAMELYRSVATSVLGREPLVEFIGDNTVDNTVDELGRSASVELEQFVCGLLNGSSDVFAYAYTMPRYAPFADALKALARRYVVADGMERGDVELKVQQAYRRIFSEKWSALGPDAADAMADRYAEQTCEWLRAQSPQQADTMIPQTLAKSY